MRPLGSYGAVRTALLEAAAERPGPVSDLAQRAQVGYSTARYTASRMVDRGELAVLQAGRPAVLGVAAAPAPDAGLVLAELQRRWASAGRRVVDEEVASDFACL